MVALSAHSCANGERRSLVTRTIFAIDVRLLLYPSYTVVPGHILLVGPSCHRLLAI
jgi:hypothetical protein